MPITEVATGLRRWMARHEEWQEDVGCLAVDTDVLRGGRRALASALED